MVHRSPQLHEFLTATREAFAARTGSDTPSAAAMKRVSASIDTVAPSSRFPNPRKLPACAHLDAALAGAMQGPADIARVARAIDALVPELSWRRKSNDDPAFANGHANTDILGSAPEAIEQRHDVWIGLSLLAPEVTYPDHSHPPEEVYLALTRGFWRHEAKAWHEPGVGGIVYNPRGITHAMRSGPAPFLAIWCLPID